MARPIKNNVDYFPHDSGMRNHKKVKAIRSKFGIQGYAVWSMLLEHLSGSDGNVFPYTDMEFELMSGDFGVSSTEIRNVVDYCIGLEMLFNENGFIKSESLDERLAPVYEKRNKAKELSKQQQRESGKFASNNTDIVGETVTETPQSKVKESKVKKNKENETMIVAAEAATIDQRKKNFMDEVAKYLPEYEKEMLREFFDYWSETNKNGKKMRFEMEKVFELKRRLNTWRANNEKRKFNGKTGIEGVINKQQRLNALIEAEFAYKGTAPQGDQA